MSKLARYWYGWMLRCSVALAACGTAPPVNAPVQPAWNAQAAWAEFYKTFTENYAYGDASTLAAQLAHGERVLRESATAADFRRKLHRMTFAFADPHVLVGPLTPADPNVFPTASDLVLVEQSGAFVVADVRADSPAAHAGIQPGWALETVGGLAMAPALDGLWQGMVKEQTPTQRAYGATLLANGTREARRVLGFRVGAAVRTLELENPRDFAKRVAKRPPVTVQTQGGVVVLRFENSLGDNATIAAFDAALAQVRDARAVVLDLRNTPSGGNTDVARAIIGHFIQTPQPYQIHEIPAVARATTVPRRFVEYALPRAPYVSARLFVLAGHWTGSMGEGLVIGLHGAAKAYVVAAPMAKLLGALWTFELEHSGAVLELGGEALFHVDGTPRAAFVPNYSLAAAERELGVGDPALAQVRAILQRGA